MSEESLRVGKTKVPRFLEYSRTKNMGHGGFVFDVVAMIGLLLVRYAEEHRL